MLLQQALDGHVVPPGQARRGAHGAVGVEGAGAGQADAEHLAVGHARLAQHAPGRNRHLADDLLGREAGAHVGAQPGDRLPREVGEDVRDLAGVEVDADGVPGGGVDPQDRAGLASAGGERPVLDDQALLQQPADDDGDGLGGEAGTLGDLDAADAVRDLDRVEDDGTVVAADFRQVCAHLHA